MIPNSNVATLPALNRPDYYILSNDEVGRSLKLRGPKKGWIFLGVGSPHVLHVLAEVSRHCRLESIVFVDDNLPQLGHLRRLISWIFDSEDRTDFLELLFCGKTTPSARQALARLPVAPKGMIRGARRGCHDDGLWEFESQFWAGFELDVDHFVRTYGRGVEQRPDGLLTSQHVVGGIDECMLTVACGTRERYDQWPFTAAFGSGFLRDENAFHQMKETLRDVPISFIAEDLTTFAESFLYTYRYHPIAIWASNLFNDWFGDRIPGIRELYDTLVRLGSQVAPHFPELDLYLIQDERSNWPVPPSLRAGRDRLRTRLSIHTRTMREISRRMVGVNRLEIVNVPHWIEKDGGISKLPGTEYKLLADIEQRSLERKYDTIFLHILVGHGTPIDEFLRMTPWVRGFADRLLILEHHRWSPDFWRTRGLITPRQIRAVLGDEQELVSIHGDRPWGRNFLMVYDGAKIQSCKGN